MKRQRGFTLIEILVVVTILVILMGIVFRLSNIGSDTEARTRTVMRLQRVENCLSGYQAAFGSYPPVKLHASRDINRKVGGHGSQMDEKETIDWSNPEYDQIDAACRAQPFGCRYPYPSGFTKAVSDLSEALQKRAGKGPNYSRYDFDGDGVNDYNARNEENPGIYSFDAAEDNPGRFNSNASSSDWSDIKLFQFGLMSYLLPRYLVMMNGHRSYFSYAQWTDNNTVPCDPYTGSRYSSWQSVRDDAQSTEDEDKAKLQNIPSQSVCARWMPNLEGICDCNHSYSLFGIDIRSSKGSALDLENPSIEIFTTGGNGGDSESASGGYVLDGITVTDGWNHELYYYSPAPYQTYRLWSAGSNGKTFPPWISREGLPSEGKRCVAEWTKDDVENLRH